MQYVCTSLYPSSTASRRTASTTARVLGYAVCSYAFRCDSLNFSKREGRGDSTGGTAAAQKALLGYPPSSIGRSKRRTGDDVALPYLYIHILILQSADRIYAQEKGTKIKTARQYDAPVAQAVASSSVLTCGWRRLLRDVQVAAADLESSCGIPV